jgi:regulator of protease activity HflC (stomatin/prohibitin superfamily)
MKVRRFFLMQHIVDVRSRSFSVAISYNTISKTLHRDVKTAGLHLNSPGFRFITFPSVFKSMEFDDISVGSNIDVRHYVRDLFQCLNRDGVTINLDATLQFQVDPRHLYDVVVQFKDYDGYKKILYATGRAAVHDTCAQ